MLALQLWIPPSNPLNVVRLAIWYSGGSYAVSEYYVFCVTPGARKLGPRAWLGLAVVATEVLIIVKFGKQYFHAPFPVAVKIAWALVTLILVVGSTVFFYCLRRGAKKEMKPMKDYTQVTSPRGTKYLLKARGPALNETEDVAPNAGPRRSLRNRKQPASFTLN